MPRQSRIDAPGILHHVMIRGIERRNIFRNIKDRKDFIDRLAFLLPETETTCYAWSFMSNHAHFLLRSGPYGIAHLMRKLLTGYVVSFNKRHARKGQLFQNRYKSIICDEDTYFKELIRYIHLNPFRSGIVTTLEELDLFPYSGHSVLTGTINRSWQDTNYVLRIFAHDHAKSQAAYRSYIETGFNQGKRHELSGGDIVRSMGGWTQVRDAAHRIKGDQRILGNEDFVRKMLVKSEHVYEKKYAAKNKGYTLEKIAALIGERFNINGGDIVMKGKYPTQVQARSLFCYMANRDLGISVTEIARFLGMTPSAVTYAVKRGKKIAEEMNFELE